MERIISFKVKGMSCKNCKAHVERGISELDGIDFVEADIETGEVRVTGISIDMAKIKDAVELAGYIYKG